MGEKKKPMRILIGKAGLDGHDRGARIIAMALRDEGMEVIYTGIRQTPESIVQAATQEDVDVVGISCLSGAHMYNVSRVAELLKGKGLGHILIIAGGIIPDDDIPMLKSKGLEGIFGPGAHIKEISQFIRENVRR